jgi:prevent-host-death family protein
VTTTISSRDFNQDVSQAQRAAETGPVVITDRGRPAFVLLRYDTYRCLIGEGESIRQLLDQPRSDQIQFEPPRFGRAFFQAPDLA